MTRERPGTTQVAMLTHAQVVNSLEAAETYDAGAFYEAVNMRNPSRSYFVSWNGRLHSLKAIVTHALQASRSDALARDFHATDAAQRLKHLGFEVVHDPLSRA